jgi:TRAP-type C4-dicarboxylate transport system permease large subunit
MKCLLKLTCQKSLLLAKLHAYDFIQSKYVFLLLLNLALLVVGCLMDIFSAILIILPLIVPLGLAYGINPVHLGIIFIVNLEVGFLTPPVGLNLFLASYRFKRSFVDICRYVFPFLIIQLAVVLLVTYIPALSTWLAHLF